MNDAGNKPTQASEPEVQERMLDSLLKESDRGAILVGSEFLNSLLEELMKLHLVEDAEVQDSLLGRDKPFGTFSSRIAGAYALGLINSEMRKRLDQIRRIRNQCAHHVFEISFADQRVRDILMEMTTSSSGQASAKSPGEEAPLQVRFLWSLGRLAGQLSMSIDCARAVGRPRDGLGFLHLVPPETRSRVLNKGG